MICELCKTYYRNIIIQSKSANFIQFIKSEPEWAITFIVNSIPLIYDLYFITHKSEFDFKRFISPRPTINFKPITIQLNSAQISFFFRSNKLNIGLKFIPITFPFEVLNMIFFIKDLCSRFKEFQRLNRSFDIDFIWCFVLIEILFLPFFVIKTISNLFVEVLKTSFFFKFNKSN